MLEMIREFEEMLPMHRSRAFMGFDGFVDTIATVSRNDGHRFDTMASLGAFLALRQERGCMLRVERKVRRMGGNMPLCANALAGFGIPVDCVGALGDGGIEPAFQAMNPLCCLHSVAQPGECLALEFGDNKLFMADNCGLDGMNWDAVVQSVGTPELTRMAGEASLIGLYNWGEAAAMQGVWEGFVKDIIPYAKPGCIAVFDLSDCSGRSSKEIHAVLAVMAAAGKRVRIVLSANDNELLSVSRALGYAGQDLVAAGQTIFDSGCVNILAHHSIGYARVFDESGTSLAAGIHVADPILVTGGGDHFNAGLCLGLLSGLAGREAAIVGNTVSRLFVSTGRNPMLYEIIADLESRSSDSRKEGKV